MEPLHRVEYAGLAEERSTLLLLVHGQNIICHFRGSSKARSSFQVRFAKRSYEMLVEPMGRDHGVARC